MELLPRLTARSVAAAVRLSGAGQASSMPGKVANALFPGLPGKPRAAGSPTALAWSPAPTARRRPPTWRPRALSDAGREIVHNSEGANLLSGIATAFARRPAARFALLEIDEAIVPSAARSPGSAARRGAHQPVPRPARPLRRGRPPGRRLARGPAPARCARPVLVANADDPLVTWVAQESGLRDRLLRRRGARRARRPRGQRRHDLSALRDHARVHVALAVAARRLPLPVVRLRAAAARPRGARAAHGRGARGGGAGRRRRRQAAPPRARPAQRLQRPRRARPDPAARRRAHGGRSDARWPPTSRSSAAGAWCAAATPRCRSTSSRTRPA